MKMIYGFNQQKPNGHVVIASVSVPVRALCALERNTNMHTHHRGRWVWLMES